LFSSIAGDDPFASLLPAGHAEMSGGRQPVRQDSKGLPARPTNPTPHPDAIVSIVVGLAESPAVANNRLVVAKRAQPRQEIRHYPYPGSTLSLVSGSAIKRITAGVKGPPLTVACKVSICWPGLHPPGKISIQTKKEYCFPLPAASSPLRILAGYKRLRGYKIPLGCLQQQVVD
jgi:hypothetical protein